MTSTPPKKAPTEDELKLILKKHNLRATSQRMLVHRAMLKLGHACADQIHEEIERQQHGLLTLASVYNTLSQMAELGVYSRRFSTNSKMYFDVNTFDHIHLYDMVNNTYKDIVDDELIALVRDHLGKKRFRGFTLQGLDIQLVCRPTSGKTRLSRT